MPKTKEFNVICTVICCVKLPCETVAEAKDFLRKGSIDVLKEAVDVTNVTMEGGIDEEAIEEVTD